MSPSFTYIVYLYMYMCVISKMFLMNAGTYRGRCYRGSKYPPLDPPLILPPPPPHIFLKHASLLVRKVGDDVRGHYPFAGNNFWGKKKCLNPPPPPPPPHWVTFRAGAASINLKHPIDKIMCMPLTESECL